MSSEPQFEHTGVDRAARPVRSSMIRGTSGIRLNGLMRAARDICFIPFDLFYMQAYTRTQGQKGENCISPHVLVDYLLDGTKSARRREPAGYFRCTANGGPTP